MAFGGLTAGTIHQLTGGNSIVAATKNMSKETTKLYRVMSDAENNNFMKTGKFSSIDGSMEAKWFATSQQDIAKWGQIFYPEGGGNIVYIEVPISTINQFHYQGNLDNIGSAYCGDLDLLNAILKGSGLVK